MNPNLGTWKKLDNPANYNVAIWPSFCGDKIATEVHDTTHASPQPQWIYLLDPVSGDTTRWNASGTPSDLGVPSCSPDGQYLAYSENKNSNWPMRIDSFPGGTPELTISNHHIVGYTSWFHNADDLVYMTYDAGNYRIMEMRGMDQNRTTNISPAKASNNEKITQWEFPAISPDGSQMAFLCEFGSEDWLCVTNLITGETDPLQKIEFVKTRWDQWQIISGGTPAWSSDSSWIYYSSADTGNWDIYRIHPDGSGKQNLTSNWSSNEIMPNAH